MIRLSRTILTTRQKAILKRIGQFRRSEGYFPSTRELSQVLGIKSPNTIFSHLQALIKKGYLKKNPKGKIIAVTESAHDFSGSFETTPFPLQSGNPAVSLAIP
jgi:repressor LexA